MSSIISTRRRLQRKPPYARLNLAQDLAEGLVACFLFDERGPGPRDLITGVKASGAFGDSGSTIRYDEPVYEYTRGLLVDNSYVTWQPGAANSLNLSAGFSVAWGGSFGVRDVGTAGFWSIFNSARTSQITAFSASGDLRSSVGTTAYSTGVSSDTFYDGKTVDSMVAWSAADTNLKWYANGVQRASVATSTTPANFGSNPYVTIGCDLELNTNAAFDGTYGYLYVFDRKKSTAAAEELAAYRWALFERNRFRFYSFPAVITVPYAALIGTTQTIGPGAIVG